MNEMPLSGVRKQLFYWSIMGGVVGAGWALMYFTVPTRNGLVKVFILLCGGKVSN